VFKAFFSKAKHVWGVLSSRPSRGWSLPEPQRHVAIASVASRIVTLVTNRPLHRAPIDATCPPDPHARKMEMSCASNWRFLIYWPWYPKWRSRPPGPWCPAPGDH